MSPAARAPRKRTPASLASEAEFLELLAERGVVLLDTEWRGSMTKYRVRCARGHLRWAMPNYVRKTRLICDTCEGVETTSRARTIAAARLPRPRTEQSLEAQARFLANLDDLGAELLETEWRGFNSLHRMRCAVGHLCQAIPYSIERGRGICSACEGKPWDALYVVVNHTEGVVKFGITRGDGERRLAVHRRRGFTTVERLFTGLPPGVAWEAETDIRQGLLGTRGIHFEGHEYYRVRALPLILDLSDTRVSAYLDDVASRQAVIAAAPPLADAAADASA